MARAADPNRRNDILAAARETFVERGYVQTRISDIAARAGIAPGTIYLYFESKEAIVLALVEQFYRRLTEVTAPALNLADFGEAVGRAVGEALGYIASEHDLLKLARLDAGLSPLLRPLPARHAFHQMLAANLEQRMAAGELHRYDPLILAELLTGMIERAVEGCLLDGSEDLARYERTLVDLIRHALLDQPPVAA